MELISSIDVADKIAFGSWKDGKGNQKELIWRVLEKNEDRVLVFLVENLDTNRMVPYNYEPGNTNWEKCSIRKWLNNYFYQMAFNDLEKKMISTTELNTVNGTKTVHTKDKVFLLSAQETRKHEKRIDRNYSNEYFWLRSSGASPVNAVVATREWKKDLWIDILGYPVEKKENWIRPAMWINIKLQS
ncbi:MAG: hypothetical protein IKH73_02220 [Erysipelotrichaceae bacterium]|nr:hypothetical protein [Erysipelotrichaceae bacterium]